MCYPISAKSLSIAKVAYHTIQLFNIIAILASMKTIVNTCVIKDMRYLHTGKYLSRVEKIICYQ